MSDKLREIQGLLSLADASKRTATETKNRQGEAYHDGQRHALIDVLRILQALAEPEPTPQATQGESGKVDRPKRFKDGCLERLADPNSKGWSQELAIYTLQLEKALTPAPDALEGGRG